jgi:hypothetical protein
MGSGFMMFCDSSMRGVDLPLMLRSLGLRIMPYELADYLCYQIDAPKQAEGADSFGP